MIEFTLDQLYAWIGQFLWPFFRVAGFVAVAPIMGESAVPAYVKIGIAVVITLAISPLVGTFNAVPTGSWAAMGIIIEQVLVGLALGLTLKMLLAAVMFAGELIGLQMGLSFASFFDPASGGNTSVMARIMNAIALLFFVAINGHLLLVSGIARTFVMLPITSEGTLDPNGFGQIIAFSEHILTAGMSLALPMLFALLTINLAMGILNRTAQQLSVFAVGFPITLTVSLGLLTIVLPHMDRFLEPWFMQGFKAMSDATNGFAGPIP